jgi:hypothetical protein
MTERLATSIEQNSTSIEEMSRSVNRSPSSTPDCRRSRDGGDERDRDGALDSIGQRPRETG